MSDLYYFYHYDGASDYYYGYGYSSPGAYYAGETYDPKPFSVGESGGNGYYYIYSVTPFASGAPGSVVVTDYYDYGSDYNYDDSNVGGGGYSNYVYASGSSGLGSEYGYVYNSSYSRYDYLGLDYYTADYAVGTDLYYYYYYDGASDYYYGYGYAYSGTYYSGEVYNPKPYSGESGGDGYYYIYSVYSGYSGTPGSVVVTDYYDYGSDYNYDDSNIGGAGYSNYVYASGSSGLGSEYGYVYNSSYSRYDYLGLDYYTADYAVGTDLYYFYYFDGYSDYYYGYGYANSGTYYTGEVYNPKPYSGESGRDGYYYIYSVYSGYSGTAGSVAVTSYYDYGSDYNYDDFNIGGYGYSPYVYASGSSGLGSEYGYVYNSSFTRYDYLGLDYYTADILV